MYSASLKRAPFPQDESRWRFAEERRAWSHALVEGQTGAAEQEIREEPPHSAESLSRLLEIVSPEDSALLSLIVFLLCDNTENDVVLLGILLYVLLSK